MRGLATELAERGLKVDYRSVWEFVHAELGLLFMTAIVELTVPDGWPIHITWAAMALGIMAWGRGRISIDYWIREAVLGPVSASSEA